jgi:NADH-quinone oxidoreductase subunit A
VAILHPVRPRDRALFPWAVALREIGAVGFWAMMIFLILVVGFAYEWKKGAPDWE